MTKSAKRKAHDANKVKTESALTRLPPVPLAPPYAPVVVDAIDIAFPATVVALMPAEDSIPDEYTHPYGKYHDVFTFWFFGGLTKFEPVLRDREMDLGTCMRHLRCVMGSFEPKHHYKEAAVRFLLDTWFSEIKWEKVE